MILSIIAAVARNGAIGYKNKLLYRLKGDMKRFKELTTNHTIIMGKNTFLSLPKGALPNRRNIVLTRKDEHFEGCETFHSIDKALEACKTENEVFIIGGAMLYSMAIDKADKLYITEVYDTPKDADAFFPNIGIEWEVKFAEIHGKDDNNDADYAFVNYEKIREE